MALVFVEFWQHQCCGEPFAVGEVVLWPLAPTSGDGMVRVIGSELGSQVAWAVERHADVFTTVSGTVRALTSVFNQTEHVEEHPEGPHTRVKAGSGVMQPVARTQSAEYLDDYEWSGYLVDLINVSGLPAAP